MADILYVLHTIEHYLKPSLRQKDHILDNLASCSAERPPPEEAQQASHLAANAACSASDLAQ